MLADNNGERTLKLMDKVGIDKKVILIIDWELEFWEATKSIGEIHKDILGICSRFRDRFIGFAGINPRRENAGDILTDAFDIMGAKGLKLHPTSQGWTLDDDRDLSLVEMTAERNLPVLVHVGDTMDILTSENAQPSSMTILTNKFPETNFIVGHTGFHRWIDFLQLDELHENLYFDISGWQARLAVDRETLSRDIKVLFSKLNGKVLFGTDCPFYGFNFAPSESRWLTFVQKCVKDLNISAKNVFNPKILL